MMDAAEMKRAGLVNDLVEIQLNLDSILGDLRSWSPGMFRLESKQFDEVLSAVTVSRQVLRLALDTIKDQMAIEQRKEDEAEASRLMDEVYGDDAV